MNSVAEMKQQALALAQAGNFSKAKALFSDIVRSAPHDAESWFLMAAVNNELGLTAEAIIAYKRTIALHPSNVDAHVNLGVLLETSGQTEEAAEAYKKAIYCDKKCIAAHYNYGNVLLRLGEPEPAIQVLQAASDLQPGNREIDIKLASALKAAAKFEEALSLLRHIILTHPDYALAHNLEGNILQAQGRLTEAVSSYRLALKYKPDFPPAYCNTGSALLAQGLVDEAKDCYARAVELDPGWAGAHSNLLLTENYRQTDARHTYELHCEWSKRHCPPKGSYTHNIGRKPARRLKIGYLSPDFRTHSVAYFMMPILSSHDSSAVEIYCYADVAAPDSTTEKLKRLNVNWRNIYSRPDKTVADLVYDDGIDILVDLAGHTANNRLPVFGMKPAPVQVTYLGYPNTTGVKAIDYRITDEYADPEGCSDTLYTETLLRLPHGFLCYAPPAEAPPVGDSPCKKHGHICFGSFNNMAKLTTDIISLWSQILKGVPNSTLMLKNSALADTGVRERYIALFKSHGIDADRLHLLGQTPSMEKHLCLYQQIDIALDTFPYNGTTTTCEALWMGVPVITLRGTLHAGRVGSSIMHQLGMHELIAETPQGYYKTAITLAAESGHLACLRKSLRNTIKNSSLCDATGFTRTLEKIYYDIWTGR